MKFSIVDVFAEIKYTGNQLAVIWGDGVESLSDEEMLKIAQEMNYSETTFICDSEPDNGGYPVRIFTPKRELPFAGHPTLGTAYIISEEIIKTDVIQVILNLAVGQIPVNWKPEESGKKILWMRQNSPEFTHIYDHKLLAPVLNLELSDFDPDYPIQEVSTGIPFIIVPLKTQSALRKAKVNLEYYTELIKRTMAKEIFIFCPETHHPENQLCARMFAPALGITEDPATGSANGCLAGYLSHYRYFGSDQVNIRVEQGYEINRPSLLLLKAEKIGDLIQVEVGGNVIKVAEGILV
ncbi:PhzF family phenazine biosynthesis protein [Planktothrix agardhii 1029]|uniref:PhzF family phenazine biosynthesis protein n=1 Tax=Planktothrix agardhii TaxID=1160 RepID=UPI001A2B0C80|nr:PhzF family phenazine biosynthesis protein [Planktothrix agardhii]MBG0746783.1 PhzF family phenazine biosynthesis protein [Planktothrix agardhii KL2]MCB8750775.1 PhzF family phenazine biosynthesis protein [Planktothrix agardhii 1810]MCB8759517.1 PhzF family phenazine biosynthesis protein [Planktothrix agardhii 1813]MCB8785789.1 PhzF family phenazine biosynthesis protein [Planktothrix agardhii 1025]MCB8787066.1 PhzF family phenazine biosynthesis protein [Planktothrix agardhii 1025]